VSIATFNQIRKKLDIPLDAVFETENTSAQPREELTNLKLIRELSKMRSGKTKESLIKLIQAMTEEE
jgi:hypothetical protein